MVILSSIFLSVLLISNNTFADETTNVCLTPSSISGQSLGIGGIFSVAANISNVNNLWGWSLGLSWNPSILQIVNITEGSFLASAGQTSLTASPMDNEAGTIANINDVFSSQTSVSGSGDLIYFTFQILNYGSTPISLTNVNLLEPAATATDSNPHITPTVTSAVFNYDSSLETTITPTAQSSGASFSAVAFGTTSTSTITLEPSPDPFNTTLKIDVRIDNASIGFWGWTISNVSWSPAVFNLTKVQEGSFLTDNTGEDPTSFVGNSKALWDNGNGSINGGLSEAIQAADTSTDSSGIVATLSFLIVGYGDSPITISGGNLRSE